VSGGEKTLLRKYQIANIGEKAGFRKLHRINLEEENL
jgi:hypothetical protein